LRNGEKVGKFSLTEKLEINQQVEFEIQTGKYEGRYPTQIVDIIDNNKFVINAPFSQGRVIRASTNTRAQIFVRGKSGLYSLPTKIVEKDFDATHLFVVELVGQVHKIQDRRYFRLGLYKQMECQLIIKQSDLDKFDNDLPENFFSNEENWDFADVDNKEISIIIDDISAGGLKLVTEYKLELGQLLDLDLSFIGPNFESVLGKVVRVNKRVKNDQTRYEIGAEFLGLGRAERDKLMSWLFAKQRELRKKGLI
jgi:c-di-GMP-binding flagellar brake protein YcgR